MASTLSLALARCSVALVILLSALPASAQNVYGPVDTEPKAFAYSPVVVLRWHDRTVSERVRQRIESLLARPAVAQTWPADKPCVETCASADLLIEIGGPGKAEAAAGRSAASAPDPSKHQGQDESYRLSSRQEGARTVIEVDGQGRGLLFGVYAALERLGYRFWHPLKPFVPAKLSLPAEPFTAGDRPFYKARGFAHHTMHPLELGHVLNGWGPAGPEDAAGWEALLPEWEGYLEWLIANGQNKVEWVLLEKASWGDFGRSPRRHARLKRLVEIGHDWGVQIGIDAPLTLEQQNGWRLIPKTGDPADELVQLRSNLDWLTATGVDFLSTEMGTSEFTHGGAAGMLASLNAATAHLADQHIPFYTKIHISSGQETEEFRDPETGGPLNINFLPFYADPRLGIMPHTVQIYALDDPAPTYGHTNFSEMHRFMRLNAGKRPMLWFPETAYWVNYDVHVPLFLPVYARQRFHDLRLFKDEGLTMDGQIIFSSGWEHGYWLNDLIAARAAWSPGQGADERTDFKAMLVHQFAPYGEAREPLVQLLLDAMDSQHRLLVLGEQAGKAPKDVSLRNGMAYLAGQDTWSQLAGIIRSAGLKGFQTQPDRLEFGQLRSDPQARKLHTAEVAPLLREIDREFGLLAERAEALKGAIPPGLEPWFAELVSGLKLNHLRARLVYSLTEASVANGLGQRGQARAWLEQGRSALQQAEPIMNGLVAGYRPDPARIAGWGPPNPTVYSYGYLWPARSLYFWKRDWLQVAQGNDHPCYLNIIDPLEVALPDPSRDARAGAARSIGPSLGLAIASKPASRI